MGSILGAFFLNKCTPKIASKKGSHPRGKQLPTGSCDQAARAEGRRGCGCREAPRGCADCETRGHRGYCQSVAALIIPPHPGAGIAIRGYTWVSGWYPAATEFMAPKKRRTRFLCVFEVFEKARCLSKLPRSYFVYVGVPR